MKATKKIVLGGVYRNPNNYYTSMSAARKYIQPYLHKVYDWTQHINLIMNPDKTASTLFTPDPAKYNSNLDLNINNKALPMAVHPKVLGLTLDPKLTYNAHIQNIATHAQKPLQVIKALTGTTWGKHAIGNTRVSVAYYYFYDNIQLYEPLGKALLFTSIS